MVLKKTEFFYKCIALSKVTFLNLLESLRVGPQLNYNYNFLYYYTDLVNVVPFLASCIICCCQRVININEMSLKES